MSDKSLTDKTNTNTAREAVNKEQASEIKEGTGRNESGMLEWKV